jgi:hypothetical protein
LESTLQVLTGSAFAAPHLIWKHSVHLAENFRKPNQANIDEKATVELARYLRSNFNVTFGFNS